MKFPRLCLLAVVAAVIALSEAEDCPKNIGDKEMVKVAHESDCHKFYECTKEGKKLGECLLVGGIRWCFDGDKDVQTCVVPSAAPCCNGSGGSGGGNGGNGDQCPCSTSEKCKMYFNDETVEVCVKKTPSTTPPNSS